MGATARAMRGAARGRRPKRRRPSSALRRGTSKPMPGHSVFPLVVALSSAAVSPEPPCAPRRSPRRIAGNPRPAARSRRRTGHRTDRYRRAGSRRHHRGRTRHCAPATSATCASARPHLRRDILVVVAGDRQKPCPAGDELADRCGGCRNSPSRCAARRRRRTWSGTGPVVVSRLSEIFSGSLIVRFGLVIVRLWISPIVSGISQSCSGTKAEQRAVEQHETVHPAHLQRLSDMIDRRQQRVRRGFLEQLEIDIVDRRTIPSPARPGTAACHPAPAPPGSPAPRGRRVRAIPGRATPRRAAPPAARRPPGTPWRRPMGRGTGNAPPRRCPARCSGSG